MNDVKTDERIKEAVRQTYGNIARRFIEEPVLSAVEGPAQASCCDPLTGSGRGPGQPTSCCSPREAAVEITDAAKSYLLEELSDLPDSVTDVSLGCGNPTAIAELRPGEVVLDLGSGGGIDCFLAAEKVGPEGRVLGLDMTTEMIKLARRNAKKIGATNVEFRYGEMEDIPLPDESVDVIISNCVINLSPDKDAVFGEAYRVLRPGGRMTISDIVVNGELPQSIRDRLDAWASCIAGALDESDYLSKIRAAGFEGVEVLSRDYVKIGEAAEWEDVKALLAEIGLSPDALDHKVASVRVKARKPA
ncbi:MAG: arsenite methyltransferase [Anaerolineae bacterium]